MTGRSYRVATAMAGLGILLALPPQSAWGQSDDDIAAATEIGQAIGSHAADAVNAASRMREAGTGASADIDAARRRYWAAVKSGEGVEAARAEFARQLWAKDLAYLLLAIPEGVDGPRARVVEMITGGIDGGIQPAARDAFIAWVRAVRIQLGDKFWEREAGKRPMLLPGPAQLLKAMEATRAQESAYIRARDWAERDRAGLPAPWQKDARAYVIMLLERYEPVKSPEQTAERYRVLIELFGEQDVHAAAEKVRAAPLTSAALLQDPAALGVNADVPSSAFAELLAKRRGENFLKYLIWQQQKVAPAEVKRRYERFVWAYGQETLDDAAARVMKLPLDRHGDIDSSHRGSTDGVPNPYGAVLHLAARDNPAGLVRHALALREETTSREDVDRDYAAMVKQYGEKRVLEAANVCLGPGLRRYTSDVAGQRRFKELSERHGNKEYPLLIEFIEKGAEALLGTPAPPAGTEERFAYDADSMNLQGWARRSFLLSHRLHALQPRITENKQKYPNAEDWIGNVIFSFSTAVQHFFDPNKEYERASPAFSKKRAYELAEAIRTLQIHCILSGEEDGEVCRLARVAETEAQDIWAIVLSRFPEMKADLAAVRDAQTGRKTALSDVLGTWSGQLGPNQPITLRLALPARLGEPLGTSTCTRNGAEETAKYLFVGCGLLVDGFMGYAGSYTLRELPGSGGESVRVAVRAQEGKLEVTWFANPQRRQANSRILDKVTLERAGGSGKPEPAPSRQRRRR